MGVVIGHIGPWAVVDVLALPGDRTTRYELLGESLVLSPAPGIRRQRASPRLAVALHAAAAAAAAPVEVPEAINVVLPSGLVVPDLVVPDLVATDAEATAEDGVSVDAEAVRLVVELVSPGNSTVDRKFKPVLCAEAAIPRFWRLESDPAPMLVACELRGGRYVERITALAGATTHLDTPPPRHRRPGRTRPAVGTRGGRLPPLRFGRRPPEAGVPVADTAATGAPGPEWRPSARSLRVHDRGGVTGILPGRPGP
ncbi:Uma2 family endonuclease [Streptomyces sp. TRM 70361]|uniref:Uma2 family endonuclease n=1 Tax=Streptomyces sp. TRM 70361 TaxID=3116553 RepID=UPI002E7C065E|nr:Uma2 family endonuclease [Streptomyces sp. TRM 70361]MEE1940621.1 Uma2 family endonuclease [Streptomyces sp. TRM 70361]